VSLWSAGTLLVVASGRNRVRRMIQRLREPRYLVGTALAGLYFYSLIGRMMFVHHAGMNAHLRVPALAIPFVEAIVFGMALLVIGGAWIFGSSKPTLQFTEAEIQLLFPAPVTRRQVLHFKLARGMMRIAFTALVAAFFGTRAGFGEPLFVGLAGFFAFGTLWLHLTGLSFTRASLLSHGRFGLRRRFGTLLALLAVIVASAWFVRRGVPSPPRLDGLDMPTLSAWLTKVLDAPPISLLAFPVRTLVRLALAPDLAGFLRWLPAVLALFAVHYLWVLRSEQAFEDGAIAAAEHRARTREAMTLTGRRVPLSSAKIGRPWLRLAPTGRPLYGLTWKNLVASQRAYGLTLLILLLSMVVPVVGIVIGASDSLGESSASIFVGGVCLLLGGMVAIVGPLVVRADLRGDIPQFEILRALPLSGRQIVWAEVLGPWGLTLVLEISLALAGLLVTLGTPSRALPYSLRISAVLAFLLVGPALTMAVLLVQNASAVLFPAWMVRDLGQPRGIEVMGQRLLNLVGTLLVLGLGLLPSAMVGLTAYFLARLAGAPTLGIVIAALASAAILWGESLLAVQLLGKVFESADPSEL
jgi:ABC-2 type transport system permease protein